jgi:hypothetical protein
MITKQQQRFCSNCNEIIPAIKRGPSHLFHFIMSVITIGAWTVVWFLALLCACSERWRCVRCGKKTKMQ